MEPEKNKNSKLSTYAIIMLLTVIIIIIIAAMADDREEMFQKKIDSTTQTNMDYNEEIVNLKDEKFRLEQENASMKKQLEANIVQIDESIAHEKICSAISSAVISFEEGDIKIAAEKISAVDEAAVPEELSSFYQISKKMILGSNTPAVTD